MVYIKKYLARRRINNPDDPFIILTAENLMSHAVELLIQSGVAERHPDDESLLQLLDLTR